MRISKNEKIENALNIKLNGDEYLSEILEYKLWHYGEAINYLLGVYKVSPYNSENEFENSILTLSGEHITETNNSDLLAYLEHETNRLHEIWKHNDLPDKQTPDFFISWAFEYDFEIPWLSYAKENGLISKKSTKANIDDDKPLNTRLENNYLELIMSLAYGLEGFQDTRDPFVAAQIIIDECNPKLSKETIAKYISKARALQSKKND